MSTSDWIAVLVGGAGVVVNGAIFWAAWVQVRNLRRQLAEQHEATQETRSRERRKSTIDFYTKTLKQRYDLSNRLPPDRSPDEVAAFVAEARSDQDKQRLIIGYLTMFEMLAAGVNTDVFDIAVIDRLAGGRVVSIVRNYALFIEERRTTLSAPNLYIELQTLAARIEARREALDASIRSSARDLATLGLAQGEQRG